VATFRSEGVSRLDHLSIINRLPAVSKASVDIEKWASLIWPCLPASRKLQGGKTICKLGEIKLWKGRVGITGEQNRRQGKIVE